MTHKRLVLSFILSLFSAKALAYPQRIVSTSIAGDVFLLDLLKDSDKKRILALSKLIDNPLYSTVLQEARTIPLRCENSIEQIFSLKPDLVLAASFNQVEFLDKLKKLKLKVHILEGFDSLADMKRHLFSIGSLLGKEKEAEKIMLEFTKNLKKYKINEAKTVLIMLPDGTLLGEGTLLDDLLSSAGYKNLAKSWGIKGWQKISSEKWIRAKVDFVLVSGEEKDRKLIVDDFVKSPARKHLSSKLILIHPAIFSSFSPKIIDVLKILGEAKA